MMCLALLSACRAQDRFGLEPNDLWPYSVLYMPYSKAEQKLRCKVPPGIKYNMAFEKHGEAWTVTHAVINDDKNFSMVWRVVNPQPRIPGQQGPDYIAIVPPGQTLTYVTLGNGFSRRAALGDYGVLENVSDIPSEGLFPIQSKYRIDQDVYLTTPTSSHKDEIMRDDRHAIDIIAPFGAPILAVADGTVIRVDQENPDNAFGRYCDNPATGNAITVMGGDGTGILYGHVMQHSMVLKIGDKVHAGEQIARVGRSGSTGMAHLHLERGGFDMQRGKAVTLPIRFKNCQDIQRNEVDSSEQAKHDCVF